MFENYFGLIEAVFVFGLAIAFYIWQMRDLAKAESEAKESSGTDNPNDTRHDRAESGDGD